MITDHATLLCYSVYTPYAEASDWIFASARMEGMQPFVARQPDAQLHRAIGQSRRHRQNG
jgi:hypothetical protein